jgi:hypothetical protein
LLPPRGGKACAVRMDAWQGDSNQATSNDTIFLRR